MSIAAEADTASDCASLCVDLVNSEECRSFSFTAAPGQDETQCYLYRKRLGEDHEGVTLVLTENVDGQHYDWLNATSSACSYGCTDGSGDSFNYDPSAEEDDGSCLPAIAGCNDPTALNHNPRANMADGSCVRGLLMDCWRGRPEFSTTHLSLNFPAGYAAPDRT